MANLNRAELIGFVGSDPQVRTIQTTGRKVASFSVATTEKGYTAQNGTTYPDRTEWHNVTAWGKLADVVEMFVHKGSQIYVGGKLRNRQYDKNGVTQKVVDIECEEMQLLDRRQQTDEAPIQQPQPRQSHQNDLPF